MSLRRLSLAAWGVLLPAGVAHAEPTSVVVGAAGGFAYEIGEGWAGLDIAFHTDQTLGAAFMGRVQLAYPSGTQRLMSVIEAGATAVVPSQEGYVRIGGYARLLTLFSPSALPMQPWPPPEGGNGFGTPAFFPGGAFQAEIGWRKPMGDGELVYAVSAELGATVGLGSVPCTTADGTVSSEVFCRTRTVHFMGGVGGRVSFPFGLYIDALAGPGPSLAVGYRL